MGCRPGVLLVVLGIMVRAASAHAADDLDRSILTLGLDPEGHWRAETHLEGFRVVTAVGADAHRERITRELVPRMQQAAADGVEPARWQVGFIYLFGWYGIPRDQARAREALSTAPASEQRLVTFAFADAARIAGDFETAERLFFEAYDAGLDRADWYLCSVAKEWSRKRKDRPRDLERADRILARIYPLASREADCNLTLGQLRFHQGRFDELYELGTRTAAQLPPGDRKRQTTAWSMRVVGAFTTDQMTRMSPDELFALLTKPVEDTPLFRWGPYAALVGWLAMLCGWAWRTRARPVGLLMAWAWLVALLTGTGLSLLFPFPFEIGTTPRRWAGTIIVTVACLIAARLRGWRGPYGDTTQPMSWRQGLWAAGLVAAVMALEAIYAPAYEALFGTPLKLQVVAGLLRVTTPLELFWTLTFVAVFIPFVEEFAFRGLLFDALHAKWGGRVALIGSSVLFGLAHVELTQSFSKVPMIIVFGLGLALLRSRTGNLRASVLAHGVNNGLAVVLLSLS